MDVLFIIIVVSLFLAGTSVAFYVLLPKTDNKPVNDNFVRTFPKEFENE